MPNVSNDLSQKLYATMEKHKEVRVSLQGKGVCVADECSPQLTL